MKKAISACALVFLGIAPQACLQDPLAAPGGGEMQVLLHVTGGFAGADFTVLLDGETRSVVGVECLNLCDFADGEVLQSLTEEQVRYVWGIFRDANVLALDGEDFGVQCCDQFYFNLDYRDREGRSRVRGSSEALPHELKTALATVQGLVSGTLPIIVNFDTDPSLWPGDAFQIEDAVIVGQSLQVRLNYGGGCRTHDVKLISWGGWMESDPVQNRLFLSHEDFDDPCDAWITRDYTFDLIPLKIAYQESYGVGQPGTTTLILLLEDPMLASPQGARRLEYVF
ncbi:MAG: hypothetical protein HKO65_15630 [Gemmatimonadetes bacterium]|nr:hypothetical protein [Gemmatimonadota bacterium]